jgi:GalNAc5-diNAcBac-PP-undecaprenol beta-1,3-glucosyltransferase
MKPKVTIIMATYNRAHFIVETLESIQAQSFKDWECLIIDDGGTDNTDEVIAPIMELDNRFQFLMRPELYTKGLPGSRNYGLDLSKGDYIIFFDDDDMVHPDNLNTGLKVIESNNVDFCHYQKLAYAVQKPFVETTPIIILQYLSKDDIEDVLTQKIGLASCTVLWKKQCFDKIRFNDKLLYGEEWECYSRLLSENFKGIIISNILYYNRKHINSNTGEFYSQNHIRRSSYTEAILLVVRNLKEKQLITYSLKRYFVAISKDFEEYNLFEGILDILELPIVEKLKWQFFYSTLPLRLKLYRIKKVIKRKIN